MMTVLLELFATTFLRPTGKSPYPLKSKHNNAAPWSALCTRSLNIGEKKIRDATL